MFAQTPLHRSVLHMNFVVLLLDPVSRPALQKAATEHKLMGSQSAFRTPLCGVQERVELTLHLHEADVFTEYSRTETVCGS